MVSLHALRTEAAVQERLRAGRATLLGLARDTLTRAVRGAVTVEQAIGALRLWFDPAAAPKVLSGARTPRTAARVLGLLPGAAGNSARRILNTETSRAHGEARVNYARGHDTLIQWQLSPAHDRTDECDAFATFDSGYGPGVYRPFEVPPYPTHPSCYCVLSVVEMTDEQRQRQDAGRGL